VLYIRKKNFSLETNNISSFIYIHIYNIIFGAFFSSFAMCIFLLFFLFLSSVFFFLCMTIKKKCRYACASGRKVIANHGKYQVDIFFLCIHFLYNVCFRLNLYWRDKESVVYVCLFIQTIFFYICISYTSVVMV